MKVKKLRKPSLTVKSHIKAGPLDFTPPELNPVLPPLVSCLKSGTGNVNELANLG